MKIKLQLFGAFRKYGNYLDINLEDNCSISSLRSELLKIITEMEKGDVDVKTLLDSSRFSNDDAILDEDSIIKDGDNLAILPPVSGG